jgi:hypothetical protein
MNAKDQAKLLETLQDRFEKNMQRHKGVKWSDVQARLEGKRRALESLLKMEETGGEPDVVGKATNGRFTFMDCSAESPKGRRSLCYDDAALKARKENKPDGSAAGMAKQMGVELLTEEQYRQLQEFGEFDTRTSTWIATPDSIRKLGGALFCDRRYGAVFTYHNGAESYYASRGFRGSLEV